MGQIQRFRFLNQAGYKWTNELIARAGISSFKDILRSVLTCDDDSLSFYSL